MNPIVLHNMATSLASGKIRTAGRIEFVRDQGPLRRDIRAEGFKWSPETLRNLAKILWAAERAHSYGIAALRMFSKMPSSEFSPDGLLGGRGYIQQIKDMRASLSQAIEVLSSFTDTVHDEVNASHWSATQDSEADALVSQAEETKQHPEQFVEDQFQSMVDGVDANDEEVVISNPQSEEMNPSSEQFNPFFEKGDAQDDEEDVWPSLNTHESSKYEPAIKNIWKRCHNRAASTKIADSSVPPETLPGPRIMHIGPAESPEEFGYFTDHGEVPSDDPSGEGFHSLTDIEESPVSDGVTGYTDPTDGDTFKNAASAIASSKCAYSWLPGNRNEKLMPYYNLGLTEDDVQWMRDNDAPDSPEGPVLKAPKPARDPLWPIFQP
ncbi:MAG TPA: hypothetical protein VIE65_22965 [Methylobacter sp.]|jgi:hypothetical protein